MKAQADILEISRACLRILAVGFDGSPHLAPEVYFVGEFRRQNDVAVFIRGGRAKVRPVLRQLISRACRCDCNGRKQLRAGLPNQITCAHVLLVCDFQILIGNGDRFFK